MGQIRSVTVQFGRTYNIGNYENIKLGLELTKDIIEGENVADQVTASMKSMKALLDREAERIVAEKDAQPQPQVQQ